MDTITSVKDIIDKAYQDVETKNENLYSKLCVRYISLIQLIRDTFNLKNDPFYADFDPASNQP